MNNYEEFIYNKKIFTIEDVVDIIKSYENKESCTKIGERYNVPHKCILKILHKYNVDVDQRKTKRKYSLDVNYFDCIDSPNKAYILGFLYADGSVNYSKSTIMMSLQEGDKNILESINKEVGSNRPLEYIDYSNKHDFGYNYKNQYRMCLFSSHMVNSLKNIGMVQNKSLVLEFPQIHQNLYSHFIRGYFDGDGSFCPNYLKNGKFQPLITFTSTENFLKEVRKILINELNISGGNIYDASCHNGITKVLSFSGVNQTKTILDWLYADSNLFLNRKYQKYINSFYLNNSLVI